MAWLQRLPQNSNSAPISLQTEGLWTERGRRGVWYEMLGAVWEGGLMLTEEKCFRLASEDDCTCLWCKVVCVCLLQVWIHACFPFLLFRLSLPEVTVLCRFTNIICAKKKSACMHAQEAYPGTYRGGPDPWSGPKLSVTTAVQYMLCVYWSKTIITSCWVVVHTELFINAVSALH